MPQDASPKTRPTMDSKTNVYKTVPMERVVVSVRVRREIKDALKGFCRENGLSICHVFEGLVIGYLYGLGEKIEFVNKSPTINMTLVRDVKRLRRYAVEEVEEELIEYQTSICGLCGKDSKKLFLVKYVSGKTIPTCTLCLKNRREKRLVNRVLGCLTGYAQKRT